MLSQIPSTITKITTMSNRMLRVQIDTQENLTDKDISSLMTKVEKYGWFCFLEDKNISEEDVLKLPPLPKLPENIKSPSQRQRAVLYRLWEQNGKKGDFELFYNRYMERSINAIKEKLT